MSVECSLFIVDWDVFRAAIETRDPFEVVDDVDPELLPDELVQTQDAFLTALDAIGPRLDGGVRSAATELFDHLFWSWRDPSRQILECGQPDTGIDLAWSPQTVHRFAVAARACDVGAIAAAFTAAESCDEFAAGDELARYADAWIAAVLRAADASRGLVLFVFA